MTYPPFTVLHTPRLTLRALAQQDLEPFFKHLGSSEAVTRYMLWQPHKDLAQSAASLQKALRRYEEGRYYRWAITLKDNDQLIGIIDLLRFDETAGTCSFAYMLGEAFWGNGYGTEALKAVFIFAFEQMGMAAITADHFTANPASGAVMRKAGMRFLRTVPEKYEKGGIRYDAAEYTLTREDWQKSRH